MGTSAKRHQQIRKAIEKLISRATTEDIVIDIFCESMDDYLRKFKAAARGRYELDYYDRQVLSVALEQCL